MLRVYSVMYLQNVWERPTDKSAEEGTLIAERLSIDSALSNTEQIEPTAVDDADAIDNTNDMPRAATAAEASVLTDDHPTHAQLNSSNDRRSSVSNSEASEIDSNNTDEDRNIATEASFKADSSSSIQADRGIAISIVSSSSQSDPPETPSMPFDENKACTSKTPMPALTVTEEVETTTITTTINDEKDEFAEEDEQAMSLEQEDEVSIGLNPRFMKELPVSPSSFTLSHKTSTSKLSTSAQKMIHRAKSSIMNEKTVKNLGRRTSLILEKINLHMHHHNQSEQQLDYTSNNNNNISPDPPLNFNDGNNGGSKGDPFILPPVSSAIATPSLHTTTMPLRSFRRQSSKLADKSKAFSKKLKRAISFHQIQALHA